MKTILLITSPRPSGWLESDSDIAKGLLEFARNVSDDQVSLYVTSLDRLEFFVSSSEQRIWDNYNKRDLSEFDLVHIRNIDKGLNVLDYARAIVDYVLTRGGKLVEASDRGFALGKLSQMMLFSLRSLPIPQTVGGWDNDTLMRNTLECLDFPVIVKANNAMKGADNYLVRDEVSLRKILSGSAQQYVAQEFIPNDGDYRILLGGLNRSPLIFKRSSIEGSHLNNTSKGAQANQYSEVEIGEGILNVAIKAAQAVERIFTGIDAMQDARTGDWVLLEANVNPALSMGAFLDDKVELYKAMTMDILGED